MVIWLLAIGFLMLGMGLFGLFLVLQGRAERKQIELLRRQRCDHYLRSDLDPSKWGNDDLS